MTFRTYDARNMNRFRLVDTQLRGTTGDSWGIELVVRALAGSRAPLLSTAAGTSIDHTQYLAYWHGLHFLTVARLGWRDPGRGLRTWYERERPSGDPTLDFIASVWGQDGTLDTYIAWATINHATFGHGSDRPTEPPSKPWMRWAHEIRDRPGLELLSGGSNPPHLGNAEEESDAIADEQPGTLTIVDSSQRRAMYVTDTRDSMRTCELAGPSFPTWHRTTGGSRFSTVDLATSASTACRAQQVDCMSANTQSTCSATDEQDGRVNRDRSNDVADAQFRLSPCRRVSSATLKWLSAASIADVGVEGSNARSSECRKVDGSGPRNSTLTPCPFAA